MKVPELLQEIAGSDEVKPRKWKVEAATRWQIDGGTEPEEWGGAKLSYEDTDGGWRHFADIELGPDVGLSDWVDGLTIEQDAPAWLVMPFLKLFEPHLGSRIKVSNPFDVSDIPF